MWLIKDGKAVYFSLITDWLWVVIAVGVSGVMFVHGAKDNVSLIIALITGTVVGVVIKIGGHIFFLKHMQRKGWK